jgi:HlyD family secretion protein
MSQSQAIDAPLGLFTEIRRGALRRRRGLVAAIVLLLVAAVATFVVVRSRPKAAPFAGAPIERRTIVRTVELSGHLDVTRRVEVSPPHGARLTRVLVSEGAGVRQGDPLAVLDDRALALEARGAESKLDAAAGRVREAVVGLGAARETRERVERLRARELASDAELEAARAEEGRSEAVVAAARAEHASARAGVGSAKLAVAETRLEAPVSGVVLKAPATTGSAVSPELGPLFVIGSALDTLRIDADVSESEVGELEPGQAATFTVPAYPKRTFQARVERVGVDARRNTAAVKYPVELRADNAENLLLPAMTATITIPVARAVNALAARDAALRFRPEGAPDAPARSRVFRLTEDGLEEVRVEAGVSDGLFTELRSTSPARLSVGTPLAIGASSPERGGDGPGISLGNR